MDRTTGIVHIYCYDIFFSCKPGEKARAEEDEIYVAAYVWPSCHYEERNADILWPEGMGEWEVIRKGTPRQARLITLFSWNEWVEGAYLLPDMRWEFGYLEAVKKVIKD
ncbi:MAG: glycoside hydrolase family 99-like domain-containing protein [Bacteroidota bacterium]|nr:glycoside hydrolase family 99-like domain-containing protein [Bacteroidota bacterium]